MAVSVNVFEIILEGYSFLGQVLTFHGLFSSEPPQSGKSGLPIEKINIRSAIIQQSTKIRRTTSCIVLQELCVVQHVVTVAKARL